MFNQFQGTDITEAFEVHHLNYTKVENVLQDYRVRDAKLPRNFKFTFKKTGFYHTLRHRVAEKLKTLDQKQAELKSKVWNLFLSIENWTWIKCFPFCKQVFIDVLLALTLLTSVLSVKFDNRYLTILSGLCLCYTVISAHNFFHRRDNFRMFYFNLSFFNYKEWRVSHAMSHHLFPNSLHDMEVALFEPFLCWIPSPMKGFVQRYLSWVYSPVVYAVMCLDQLVKRIVFSISSKKNMFESSDAIPLVLPLFMIIFGTHNPFTILKVWLQIILVKSFVFALVGLNAGHHHPDNVHEGDKIRWFFMQKNSGCKKL